MISARRVLVGVLLGALFMLALTFAAFNRAMAQEVHALPFHAAAQALALIGDFSLVASGLPDEVVYVPVQPDPSSALEVLTALGRAYGVCVLQLPSNVVLVAPADDSGGCEYLTAAVLPESDSMHDGADSLSGGTGIAALGDRPSGEDDLSRSGTVPASGEELPGDSRPADGVREESVDEPQAASYIIRLRIVEIAEQHGQSAGFDWQGGVWQTVAALMAGDVAAAAGRFLASDVTSAVRFLESEGVGRQLDDLSFVARSGLPAVFNAGGNISVNLVSGTGEPVSRQYPYGLSLRVTPESIEDGALLTVQLDASTPVSVSNPELLNISNRSISSSLEVGCSEAVVLGSLFQLSEDGTGSGLPGISSVPGVGYLAGTASRAYSRSSVVLTLDLTC